LSPKAAEQLFETVIAINRDGIAILMVEQNALEALAVASRASILVAGRNSRDGAAEALAADPEIRRLFLGG
jgi:branched-chain amino acid transport system ATP-binding protein/neutral amino acid transport system ATP-binding protein